jgi:hypothetical protein
MGFSRLMKQNDENVMCWEQDPSRNEEQQRNSLPSSVRRHPMSQWLQPLTPSSIQSIYSIDILDTSSEIGTCW